MAYITRGYFEACVAVVVIFLNALSVRGDEAASSQGPMLRVTVPVAEIKVTENGAQRVIGTVPQDTQLWALQTAENFFRVRHPSTGEKGWIWKKQVAVIDLSAETNAKLEEALAEAGRANRSGQFDMALASLQRVLNDVTADVGDAHPHVASLHFLAAQMSRQTGNFPQGIVHLQKAAGIFREVTGEDSEDFASAIGQLGLFHLASKQFQQAESLLKQSADIRKQLYGSDDERYAECLNSLGGLYSEIGELSKADAVFTECLEIRKKTSGTSHPDYAVTLNNVAQIRRRQGRYPQAEALMREGLEIRRNALGDNHPDVATAYCNLASLYVETADFSRSRPLLQRALEIRKAAFGRNHQAVADVLNQLGLVAKKLDNKLEALQHYHDAVDILEDVFGKGHPRTTAPLNNMAMLMLEGGNAADARDLLIQVTDIIRSALGEDHVEFGASLNNLAGAYQHNGEINSAIQTYQKALNVHRKALGANHPEVINTGSNLAHLQFAQKRESAAKDTMSEVRRAVSNHAAIVLPFVTQQRQLNYLDNLGGARLDTALREGLRFESVQRESAEWLLNGKYLAGESLAASRRLLRSLAESSKNRRVTELNLIREQQATLAMVSVPAAQITDYQAELKRLEDQEEKLLLQMSSIRKAATSVERYVRHNRVVAALPQDSVLIDIARLPEIKAKRRLHRDRAAAEDAVFEDTPDPGEDTSRVFNAPSEYVAWLTFPSGKVRVVKMGNADRIDSLVAAARREIAGAVAKDGILRREGDVVATEAVMLPLRKLADTVWSPLAKEIGKAEKVFLSPDGALWLTPWYALPVSEGNKYLIEQLQIQYVTSGRDLARPRNTASEGSSVVFANPLFGSTASEDDSYDTHQEIDDDRAEGGLRKFSGRRLIANVAPLPGTESEAFASVRGIVSYTQAKPILHLREEAIEATAKTLRSPRLLSFATHGFFLPTTDSSKENQGSGPPNFASNPLLRCGILLAGCNREHGAADSNDGVLTGLEIAELNLRGTELVVLSACDTGLGDIRVGEGVAGLRQAFFLAGANGVIASLWSVPDVETARLMELFYDFLAKGMTHAEALRQAQLARIQARRERHGAAHPFFWSAMTFTGLDAREATGTSQPETNQENLKLNLVLSEPDSDRDKMTDVTPRSESESSVYTNSLGMKFTLISPGSFLMGTPSNENRRKADEGPQREVNISRPFYAGMHEVTIGQALQWLNSSDFAGDNEKVESGRFFSHYDSAVKKSEAGHWIRNANSYGAGDDQPMQCISWHGAVAFCDWLSHKDPQRNYRLPTEAEWEYMSRAGRATAFHWKSDLQEGVQGNFVVVDSIFTAFSRTTKSVGSYPPNDFGLFDTAGNVAEWCSDWYGAYPSNAESDPQGPPSGSKKVVRGGNWVKGYWNARSGARDALPPTSTDSGVGFRVVFDRDNP